MTTPVEQKQKPALGASSKACPKFRLGSVVATPAALGLLETAGVDFLALINRHVRGDFGDLCAEDWELNTAAIEAGERILSSYQLATGKVWLITEADRNATTVLLPSDY